MKKILVVLGIVLCVAIAAIFLTPAQYLHTESEKRREVSLLLLEFRAAQSAATDALRGMNPQPDDIQSAREITKILASKRTSGKRGVFLGAKGDIAIVNYESELTMIFHPSRETKGGWKCEALSEYVPRYPCGN